MPDRSFLPGTQQPLLVRPAPPLAADQPRRAALRKASADVKHPGRRQANLRGNRHLGEPTPAQPNHLPSPLLLGGAAEGSISRADGMAAEGAGESFRMSTCLIARTWQSRLSHQDNEGRINKSLGRLPLPVQESLLGGEGTQCLRCLLERPVSADVPVDDAGPTKNDRGGDRMG